MSHRIPDNTHILVEADEGQADLIAFLGGQVYTYSARSPGKTRPNEDAAIIVDCGSGSGVLAVADGLGGQPGADQASGILVAKLAQASLEFDQQGKDLDAVCERLIEAANLEVCELGLGAGTTLAMTTVGHEGIKSYHVGDSMIYVVGPGGELKHRVVPHSPIGYAVEAGLLTEEEALHHPDRHIISNMVGSLQMKLETGPRVPFGAGDTLLIASDGLTDNLRTAELIEILGRETVPGVGDALVQLASERMHGNDPDLPSKRDDLTLIVYRSA